MSPFCLKTHRVLQLTCRLWHALLKARKQGVFKAGKRVANKKTEAYHTLECGICRIFYSRDSAQTLSLKKQGIVR